MTTIRRPGPPAPGLPTSEASGPSSAQAGAPAPEALAPAEAPAPEAPAPEARLPGDGFEPGASFVNQLLSLDANADGQLSRAELDAGTQTLQQLARDGKESDFAEASLLQMMLQGGPTPAADTPALRYHIEEGRLQLQLGERALSLQHTDTSSELPSEILLEAPEAKVIHGSDPGDFYCEHMFFSAQLVASSPGSSVLTNPQGEKMVGFLHVPGDAFTGQTTASGYTQQSRHQGTREVVASAIRGFTQQASGQVEEGPLRLLLSGYETFHWVKNNPTGDFVAHRENLDASMKRAFGDDLLCDQGELLPATPDQAPNARTYAYSIRDPDTGEARQIQVTLASFAVDDTAISPDSESSIQQIMGQTSPHAVISMGVAGRGAYKAEHQADSGGLLREGNSARHVERAPDAVQLRDNFSLARAISSGAQLLAPTQEP